MNAIDLSNISPTTILLIMTLTVAGVTEWGKHLWYGISNLISGDPRAWDELEKTFIITLAAIAGYFVVPIFGDFITGLNASQLHTVGILLGFNAAGAITIAFNWGKRAEPTSANAVPVRDPN